MSYVTKQAILEHAGLQHRQTGAELAGLANGTNTVFTTEKKPIVDSNYDDAVTTADVIVYVNGSPVTVSSINAVTGAFTLAAAPVNGSVVTADYSFSNVTETEITQAREDAEDAINDVMGDIDTVPYETVPATVRKIAKWYAAGLLLSRDYGFQSDSEETSKSGRAVLKQAETWLDKYAERGGKTSTSSAVSEADVSHEPDVFTTYDSTTDRYTSSDELFMRDIGNDD
jgi:hypothetical protein